MDKPKMSEARRRANKKWNDANMNAKYDHLHVIIPKGRKADIDEYVANNRSQYRSVNNFVSVALRKELHMGEDEWESKVVSDEK